MNEGIVKVSKEVRKRGRKAKGETREYELKKDQKKFFVDLSNGKEELRVVQDFLVKANNKSFGREVTYRDVSSYAISKLTDKDIEKVQDLTISEMEKVERSLVEFNKKNNTNLSMGEYLIKKLNLN